MAKRIVTRGNTAFFTFTFYDENDDVAIVVSAEVQLTYPGDVDFVTETIALQASGTDWIGEWDTTKSRPGWVEAHPHAYASGVAYAQDLRFRVSGNRANLDHDALPASGTPSGDAMINAGPADYS
jgi:hypothetical protein